MVRTNPVPVLVANIVWLVACAYLVFVKQDWYFGAGAALAVANVAWMALGQKLALLANWKQYAKTAVSSLLFWPLATFDQVYAWLAPKL
jgi:hypothetical protein